MRSAVCRRLAARKSLFCPHAIKFLRRRTDSIDIFGHFCKNPIRLSKNTAQIIIPIGSAVPQFVRTAQKHPYVGNI